MEHLSPPEDRYCLEFANQVSPYNVHNGLMLTHLEEGKATVEVELQPHSLNFGGSAHGGLIYSLCDYAAGCTVLAYLEPYSVTLSGELSFLRPGFGKKLIARAEAIKRGRISVVDVDVFNDEGTHIAHGLFQYCRV